jgi:uncharacterized membrane protein
VLSALVLSGAGFHLTETRPLSYWTAMLLAMAGSAFAIFLLAYEADSANPVLQEICQTGSKINCNAVLDSKFATINGIRWSEVGFFYFSAQSLMLWLPAPSPAIRDLVIELGALFTSPFVVASIYFQSRVIRQWCPLCLAAQAVLVAELARAGFDMPISFPPFDRSAGQQILEMVGCILTPIVFWYGLKPLLYKAKDGMDQAYAHKRLQLKPGVFHALLQQQPTAPDGWQNIGLAIGDPAAPIKLLKVCNPYCRPCAIAHRQLKEFLEGNEKVQLRIVFTSPASNRSEANLVIKQLLSIAAQGSPAKTRQALDDWYLDDKRAFEVFAGRYPVNEQPKDLDKQLEYMFEWCKVADIAQTPTLFIDGYKLPEGYQIRELQKIL